MRLIKADHAHTDSRGSILDLAIDDEIGAVTHVSFTPGAVRGNHIHNHTTQWNYVASGSLQVVLVDRTDTRKHVALSQGDLLRIEPGEAHALRADEATDLIVFTLGPRAGKEYESDTIRLADPLIPANG